MFLKYIKDYVWGYDDLKNIVGIINKAIDILKFIKIVWVNK